MAGTRTAPTVGALTATSEVVSLGLVDASGDVFSESIGSVGSTITDMADIEAWAAAYQPATQASLFRVTQQIVWEGARDSDNANALFRGSVADGINLLFRDPAIFRAGDGRVVAPIATIMQGNQDIPLLVSPLTALVTAYLTLLNDAGDAYSLESMQFTGRRERRNNPRINT